MSANRGKSSNYFREKDRYFQSDLTPQLTVSEEVRLLEIIAQKDAQNRLLQAENERQSQEIKLLKEKIDLLIRRLFGSKSEKLDAAQLELLLKEDALGKADASAEKAEASPNVGALKPVAKGSRACL